MASSRHLRPGAGAPITRPGAATGAGARRAGGRSRVAAIGGGAIGRLSGGLSRYERSSLFKLDPTLLFASVVLILLSVAILGVTTQDNETGDPYYFLIRQAIYAVLGIALMLAVAQIDYSRFRELRVGLYTVMMMPIFLVLLLGSATRGSRRWIELPFFRLQPSELGKVLLIVALAAFALEVTRAGSERRRTIRLVALGLFPAAVVFVQPDLGTGLVYGVITATVMFIGGVSRRHFVALGGIAVAAATIVLVVAPALGGPSLLQGYQVERLTSFLNPSDDPSDAGYHLQQSKIAVGSGGKFGQGADSSQSPYGFLPEGRTDFIFATIAERWGFVGSALILSLYALIIWRALRILMLSKNLYGSMIAGGIAAMLMFHVFINVGMNLAIMPVTGIPLPLMSYGGSSALVTFVAIGLLQSIYIQARLASGTRAQPLF